MAPIQTSLHPPHKQFNKPSRPDDDDVPKFLPIPQENTSAASPSKTTTQATSSNQEDPTDAAPDTTYPNSVFPPELAFLAKSYNVATMSIISSSKIEQKVRTLLSHLNSFSFGDINCKPGLVVLHAKAPVASKMVSMIGIATREVTSGKGKLYQYSRLSSELQELKERDQKEPPKEISGGRRLIETEPVAEQGQEGGPGTDVAMEGDEDEQDSEPAFETMREKPVEQRKKIRAVPVFTVYLSRVLIAELEERFGEQVNA